MDMLWSLRHKNHLFIFYKGEPIYKRWYYKDTNNKAQNSILFNKQYPNEWIK